MLILETANKDNDTCYSFQISDFLLPQVLIQVPLRRPPQPRTNQLPLKDRAEVFTALSCGHPPPGGSIRSHN